MASRSSLASRWSGSTRLRGVSKPDRGNEMATGRYARVAAVGSALPGRVVPNSYFESIVDTSDQWIQERTGIKERRFARSDESTGSLSAEAATAALRRAGVGPESVDLLIIATCTPERSIPSTAAFVQARLGMTCPSFDLNAACAGFVYGLSVADAQIRAGAADRILLVGAEVLSRVLDMTDRTTCVLFGDGAGAALLEASDEPGLIDSLLALDGGQAELLTVPAGGSGEPITSETLQQRRNFLRMLDGQAVFKQAVTAWPSSMRRKLRRCWRVSEVIGSPEPPAGTVSSSAWPPSSARSESMSPGSSLASRRAAPAPSPNRTQVVRSVMSRTRDRTSAPTRRMRSAAPARIWASATDSPYTKPAQAALRSNEGQVIPRRA